MPTSTDHIQRVLAHQEQSERATYFRYLDALRASGETNMFGAAPYLMRDFGLDRRDARHIHKAWMKTFDGKSSVEDRVAASEVRG